MKIVIIKHADDGFETIAMDVDDPDAEVVINFPEGKFEMKTKEKVSVHDRDTGEDITELLKALGRIGPMNPPPFAPIPPSPSFKQSVTDCFGTGVAPQGLTQTHVVDGFNTTINAVAP